MIPAEFWVAFLRSRVHDRVQVAFAETQTSVGDFLKRTAAISDLTHQAQDIAGQTNLLALNATIEAAGAAVRLEH